MNYYEEFSSSNMEVFLTLAGDLSEQYCSQAQQEGYRSTLHLLLWVWCVLPLLTTTCTFMNTHRGENEHQNFLPQSFHPYAWKQKTPLITSRPTNIHSFLKFSGVHDHEREHGHCLLMQVCHRVESTKMFT